MSAQPPKAPPESVKFTDALRFWCKLGFVSFGGPAGQIAILHEELVVRRRWISERRFLHALNYCMLLPGPEAQQLATYMGWLLHRTAGGLAAGVLFVLPSLIVLTALSWLYVEFGTLSWVTAVFAGIKPAIVAIVAFAAWRIGARVLRSAGLVAIALLAFLAIFVLSMPFPAIIAGAAVLGWLGSRWLPRHFQAAPQHSSAMAERAPALVDDDTPTPEHAAVRWSRLLSIALAALLLWAGAFGALLAIGGADGTLSQMGWFFTKAALVTFGGAYAVLPYVFQGAVLHYEWLTPLEMIDGLALGETTPGPLIMVVAFVGFLGAWGDAAELALAPPLAGIIGASVVTFFTFLPSFVFIFVGAPFVEATRGHLGLATVLTGITAAAVGVIVNLAVFFAYHVLWPAGFAQPFSWSAATLGIGAAVALFRFGIGIIPVLLMSGVAGLGLGMLQS